MKITYFEHFWFRLQMKKNISDFEFDFCFAVEKHYKSSFVDVLDTF